MESTGGYPKSKLGLRLRRTTVEYANVVSIPIEDSMVIPGTNRLDPNWKTTVAGEIGNRSEIVWYLEDRSVEPHPVQKAPEPNEDCYCPPGHA